MRLGCGARGGSLQRHTDEHQAPLPHGSAILRLGLGTAYRIVQCNQFERCEDDAPSSKPANQSTTVKLCWD